MGIVMRVCVCRVVRVAYPTHCGLDLRRYAMRCPNCGHNNNDLATRCSACGSPLPTSDEATVPNDLVQPGGTAERDLMPADAPQPAADQQPELGDVARTVGSFTTATTKRVGDFFRSHERALGLGIALCVVAIIGIVWGVTTLSNVPTYAQIEADMSSLLPSYQYSGGTYGPDLDIPLSHVSVTKRERAQTPQGMEANARGGAYRVEAEAVYDDEHLHVVRNVGASYVFANDSWSIVGELDEQDASLTARAGVDENKVLAHMDTILSAAGGVEPLQDIYDGGSFTIEGSSFEETPEKDTATDDVVIGCKRETGFYAYDARVTARFAFESGEWCLRSVDADGSASQRNYSPLVGTWSGTLVDCKAVGSNCYGAQDHPLTVIIESVGDSSSGSGQVQGYLSGIGHFHERLEKDRNATKGDEALEDVAFTGIISTTYDSTTESSLNVECTTPGDTRGEVSMVLSFGTSADPSAVIAQVTTTHRYEELVWLLFPHQATARFTDTYLLERTT